MKIGQMLKQKSWDSVKIFQLIPSVLLLIYNAESLADDFPIHHSPQSYVLNKFKSHAIVFLGTRHKQPPILEFISELITVLHNFGVTHIGLEIASDQQGKIDGFIKTTKDYTC